MRFFLLLLSALTIIVVAQTSWSQPVSSQSSFHCLDPSGTEFNIVGPVNTWYSRAERGFIASPHSKADACIHITKLCNSTYPEICQNDCLAGNAVGNIDRTCRDATPISPANSAPDVRHEVWFIKSSTPAQAPPPEIESHRQIYYPGYYYPRY